MSTKLHELLAVEQGLSETANRVTKETTKTLDTKKSIFEGMSKSHEIFDDDKQHLVQATEIKEVQSTATEQLDYLCKEVARYWDVTLQKEEANQRASADIVIEGKVLASNVPAIVLLSMEKKLSGMLPVYNALPTLDAARSWIPDPAYAKKNVFRTTHFTERQHSVTTKKIVEVSKATQYHPAQLTEQETVDVIGKYTINEFSGAISSYDKAEKIQRLTALIRAVKTARQRANAVEVITDLKFADDLFAYVNGTN